MFSGPPLPLSCKLPLSFLLGQTRSADVLGAWVRIPTRSLGVRGPRGRILLSRDLGFLLRRCARVALRQGDQPMVLETDEVIRWRVLQVVTATPHLPDFERLTEIFPGAAHHPAGFYVPLQKRPPEEVLADCLTHGIPVAGSRIAYSGPARPPSAVEPISG